jgi:hypothetical protein
LELRPWMHRQCTLHPDEIHAPLHGHVAGARSAAHGYMSIASPGSNEAVAWASSAWAGSNAPIYDASFGCYLTAAYPVVQKQTEPAGACRRRHAAPLVARASSGHGANFDMSTPNHSDSDLPLVFLSRAERRALALVSPSVPSIFTPRSAPPTSKSKKQQQKQKQQQQKQQQQKQKKKKKKKQKHDPDQSATEPPLQPQRGTGLSPTARRSTLRTAIPTLSSAAEIHHAAPAPDWPQLTGVPFRPVARGVAPTS